MRKVIVVFITILLLSGCSQTPQKVEHVTTNPAETTIPEETSETATVAITYSVIEESTEEKEEDNSTTEREE